MKKKLLKIRQTQHELLNQKIESAYKIQTLRKLSELSTSYLKTLFDYNTTAELNQQFFDAFMYEVQEVYQEQEFFQTLQMIDDCYDQSNLLPIGKPND